MANYPRFSTYFTPRSIIDLYDSLRSWGNELARELDTRDAQVDGRPSTNIYTVVSVSEIGRPANGDVAFAASAGKYRGYVSGTGWVDFN